MEAGLTEDLNNGQRGQKLCPVGKEEPQKQKYSAKGGWMLVGKSNSVSGKRS